MQRLYYSVFVMAVAMILLFLCNSAWAETPDQHPCPINEEFQPNGGPECEDCGAKCESWLMEAKCYCKTNFSRLYGTCIPDFACPILPPEAPDEHLCPENEEFHSGGPVCENCGIRCESLTSVAKCYCKSGYWRLHGVCVPESYCPKEPPETPDEHLCPVNEEFRPDGGPACENCGPRCEMWSTEAKCYCKAEHSRMNGICILDKSCPTSPDLNDTSAVEVEVPDEHPCPVNEEFRPDGGPACENCGPQCKMWSLEAKCYCKSGHSRMNGICIPDKACPPPPTKHLCPVNEIFRPRGGPKCENCGPRCLVWSYSAKCYCKSGFSRRNGICIPNSLCPRRRRKVKPQVKERNTRNSGKPNRRRCPVNEINCPQDEPVRENCGRQFSSVSTEPNGDCKDGFSRFNGRCIPNSQCPKTQHPRRCPQGEEFREIGPRCEYCLRPCAGCKCLAKCYCLPGSSRNLFGKCISPEQCLRHRGSTADNKK